MAVRRKGNKWQVDVTVKGTRLPRYSFGTEDEAKAWEAEARLCALQGRALPQPSMSRSLTAGKHTLKQAFTAAMVAYWKGKAVERKYSFIIEELCQFFGGHDTSITEIDEQAIDQFVTAQEQKGRKGQTINHKLAVLSKTLKLAYRHGHINRLPLIERKSIKNGRIRFLSESEEQEIIHWFTQWSMLDWRDAFIVFVDTGMRMNELWKLKPEDINWTRKTLSTESKTGLYRSVPMTKRVQTILRRRSDGRGTGTLWGHPGDSLATVDRAYEAAWRRVRAQMGKEDDPGFIRYITRHTCASRLVQNGADLAVVKQWLGHTSIVTTMRYAHLAPKHVEAAVQYLERGD